MLHFNRRSEATMITSLGARLMVTSTEIDERVLESERLEMTSMLGIIPILGNLDWRPAVRKPSGRKPEAA